MPIFSFLVRNQQLSNMATESLSGTIYNVYECKPKIA